MIRVGYLSNTFSNHPGSHLISGLFRLHDRTEFEISCFSYGKDDHSYYRKRAEQEADQFFDISQMNDTIAAELIRQHQMDILVDLRGFTHANRLRINAFRPASIHVIYLGYPGTTGADFIDYIVADKIVIPESHAQYFCEKVVYMPHCYQVNDNTQKIHERLFHRTEFNIPDEVFAFCCFCTHYKIEPIMFDCWARILKRVPQSVLCLLEGSKSAEKNLKKEMVNRGVDEKRLLFQKKMPKDEHLARIRLFDLSLDTRIVNGHTTTSDALWAGVPVVTIKGGHFSSRVSASILNAIGLAELITNDIGEYEELAVDIANNPEKLQALKKKVETNRLTAPLFDTPRFTRNLERAYREMVNIAKRGESPKQIDVQQLD
jgi:protein O-GlcNAc transferase